MSSIGDDIRTTAESSEQFGIPTRNQTSSTQEGKSTTQSVGKPEIRKSWVWSHYNVLEGFSKNERRASCVYCENVIFCPSNLGTSSLANLLTRCGKSPFYKSNKKMKVVEMKSPIPTFDQERSRRALAIMIMIDELPFSHVEKEGFRSFVHEIQPNFDIPSRATATRDCYKLFLEEKRKLKQFFGKLTSSVCLTTDLWRSIQNIDYLCLTAHFVDDNWTLHKKVINFCPIANHSGELIGKIVERCLLEWGISRVLTVTVDNASSNDVGLQYLKRRLNSWKGTILNRDNLHMRCATHVLNLIVKEGFRDLNEHISRIRAAVKYVKSSPARSRQFKSCVEIERIESKGMPSLDVETRWNSTYLMLKSALKFQKAFEMLETVDKKFVAELNDEMPTDCDWRYATSLLPFLKFFYDTTVHLSGSQYVTENEYMLQIYGIGLILSRMMRDSSNDLSLMAFNMKAKFDKYWTNFDKMNMLIFIAAILDPRYKLSHVCWVIDKVYDTIQAEELKGKVKTTLYAMFDVYGPVTLGYKDLDTQVGFNVLNVDTDNAIGAAAYMNTLYAEEHDDSSSVADKTELDVYLLDVKTDRNDTSFDILNWWKANARRYPTLALMARDVLAIPVSTVASESTFSTGGRVLDSFRSSLSARMVEAVICAQDWLRKSHQPLNMEEYVEELENFESEIIGLNEEHPIVDIDG